MHVCPVAPCPHVFCRLKRNASHGLGIQACESRDRYLFFLASCIKPFFPFLRLTAGKLVRVLDIKTQSSGCQCPALERKSNACAFAAMVGGESGAVKHTTNTVEWWRVWELEVQNVRSSGEMEREKKKKKGKRPMMRASVLLNTKAMTTI
ncbi:uncharacterized protein BDZ99DRAFT_262210 [Mytilinidion resinicola]|uniref:Uncharacterized protein n=1 Tax=Mytilinidion resinicola TaxID=574789 RepID=A0A6A6YVX9_9PEZI|nr:uncharacterized protein BDZ99DRAFT_262210 [Mytilinidion resinicola]KAF2812135.1 hypothetical protein BDZ99DRAFT_262210 [Mytilinidion resinicola]